MIRRTRYFHVILLLVSSFEIPFMKEKQGCKAHSISIGDQVKPQLLREIFSIIFKNFTYENIIDEPHEIAETEEY